MTDIQDTEEPTTLHDMAMQGPKNQRAPGYQVRVGAQPAEAPLYLLRKEHFLYNRLWPAGSRVRWADKPSSEMVLIDETATTAQPSDPGAQARAGRQKASKDAI